MTKNNVLRIDIFHVFFLLLTIFDIPMLFAILGNGMSPKFRSATRLLTNLELNAFLFLGLR